MAGPAIRISARRGPDEAAHSTVVARIAARYDALPYTSHPFPQCHPGKLGSIAKLFGLSSRPVEGSRVLEIGCASGGNLIPLAASYPDAEFVGVEVSAVQAAQACARVNRLGLANIQIVVDDVANFSPIEGAFDYVICHGVYSWAPKTVRAAILRVTQTALSDEGVAFVSYNVLPGWRHKQMLRDALMWRLKGVEDPKAQVAYARQFMRAVGEWKGSSSLYHRALREAAEHASAIRDDYLAHEFLENDNEPETFADFLDECAAAGLAFLGESEVWLQLADNFDPPTRELLRNVGDGDVLSVEQLIDIATGRTFRQSVIVRAERSTNIDRRVDAKRLIGLHLLGPIAESPNPPEGYRWAFEGRAGRLVFTNDERAKRAFDAIAACGPASMRVEEILGPTKERTPTLAGAARVLDTLLRAVFSGVLEARTSPVKAAIRLVEKPIAPLQLRLEAAWGMDEIANLRHEPFKLDVVSRLLLQHLDGTCGLDDLEARVVDHVAAGELKFLRDGAEVVDPAAVRECAAEHARHALETLLGQACLASV